MNFSSTVDPSYRAGLAEAVADNVPPTGGLYQPLLPPAFDDVEDLLALDWRRRSSAIMSRLLAPDFSSAEVDALVDESFDFPLPCVPVAPKVALLELFHGPTLSFKDFGVRFQAALMARLRERARDAAPRLVLTATSGDTGAAVADAFARRPGFRVAVLYPVGRISPLQERQIATLGGGVRAFAVEGTFDDCQRLVKDCFADAELHAELGLVSANSIHVARLLAQVPYYFEAASRMASGAGLLVAVPSGNFGNLCAGLMARRLGAPIRALVAATNLNRTVPDFLDGRPYAPRPSVATLSNAMDVGAPSNWQRVAALCGGDAGALRRELRWGSADEDDTRAALAELGALGYRADPHTAVAWSVLRSALRADEAGVVLATAHPAKFEVTRDPDAPLPGPLARAAVRPLLAEPLVPESRELRARLRAWTAQPSSVAMKGSLMSARIPVAVLGATGVVGQRFVRRLAHHPWFELRSLAASERSAGKRYRDACEWRLGGEPYAGAGELMVAASDAASIAEPIVFSALDSGPARELEPALARAGAWVFSNASAFRMESDVPLLVPEVNGEHLALVEGQRAHHGWPGAIVCNPNCTATVLVMALAPLHVAFGIEAVLMTSMQAASGAGYPGVPSLDILGNIIPFIAGEEEKVEAETRKMLDAEIPVSALCNRVPVVDGHSEAVSVRLRGNPAIDDVRRALADWRPAIADLGLPSAPPSPLRLHEQANRPQPRLDLAEDWSAQSGMTVHVGRVRPCSVLGIKLNVLGHNAERGAAGGSVLNAELALARGLLKHTVNAGGGALSLRERAGVRG